MTPPLLLSEAQARLMALARPLGPEALPAEKALGRYLWSDLVARRTQPAADLSAMDGYAVAEPLTGPWTIIGESAAGRPFRGSLTTGDAIRISTGALMPIGASAILLQEDTVIEGQSLSAAEGETASPRHIRRKGFDYAVGEVVLPAGTRIGAPQLALAVSSGHGNHPVQVGRLPRVAIIDSGDELSSAGSEWDDHRIPASNGAMIEAMVSPIASRSDRLGPVPDRLEALIEAFSAAEDADVIVTTGGASVGEHDLVKPALEAWGASLDFWRVAMRPGKPLLVARRGSTLLIGLPGNPVSSYVTAYLFVLPLLRRIAGAASPLPHKLAARLSTGLKAGGARLELIRATLDGGTVTPLDQQDSSGLKALASANALIHRDIAAPPAEAGDVINVYSLENGGTA